MTNVIISEGARCYDQYNFNGECNVDETDQLRPLIVQLLEFSASHVLRLIHQWQIRFQQQRCCNFNDSRFVSDNEYKVLISLSKVQIEDLV